MTAVKSRLATKTLVLAATASLFLTVVSTPAYAGGDSKIRLDRAGDVGSHTSIVSDANGLPVVSYYDATNGDLKIARCTRSNCRARTIASPDTNGDVGRYTSIALDPSGFPVVAYYDVTNRNLKVLHCNDVSCAGGDDSMTSPDTGGDVGSFTSLVLDGSGNPVVSYHAGSSEGHLKILHCGDPNCTSGNSITVADDGVRTDGESTSDNLVGRYTSLALDSNGFPVVSYHDTDAQALLVAHCNDVNCAGGDESIGTIVEGSACNAECSADCIGCYTSLALDAADFPVISHIRHNFLDPSRVYVSHCNDTSCVGGDETSSFLGASGFHTSLELVNGNPVVAFATGTGVPQPDFQDPTPVLRDSDLGIVRCNDPNCAGGDESIGWPETRGVVGPYASLALGGGFPIVSHYDAGEGDLRLLICNDPGCA